MTNVALISYFNNPGFDKDALEAAIKARIGAPLTAIDAANPGANQALYFTSLGEADVYTLSAFVRALSASLDGPEFLDGIGAASVASGALALTALQPGAPSGSVNFVQGGTDAVLRTLQSKVRESPVTPQDFGAVGDAAHDDSPAFQSWINYLQATRRGGYIPFGYYVLSHKVLNTFPVNIDCDQSASMRWTNEADCGWLCDFRAAGSNFGSNTIKLPALYAPGVSSTFGFSTYPARGWDPTIRAGTGFTLWGGSRLDIKIKYMAGFVEAFKIEGTYDAINGARGPDNITVYVNTIDLCEKCVMVDSGPSNAKPFGAVLIETNTLFGKFPVWLSSSNLRLSQVKVSAVCAFANEKGGACVYQQGNQFNTSQIDVQWAFCGQGADSPAGTPDDLTLPFVAGDRPSNGLTTEGNSELGYFGGFSNTVKVGFPTELIGMFQAAALPAAGLVTRFRDVGTFNDISCPTYPQNNSAVEISTATLGEANFGIGAAGISKLYKVAAIVPTLAVGATAVLGFYHTLLSAGLQKPLRIIPLDGSVGESGMSFSATDFSGETNREGRVTVTNKTAASVPGATYTFWIEIG